MITAENIEFSYDKDEEFIKNLNIKMEKGRITTIIGPNGSGKSTLLNIISGINKIQNGSITVENIKINETRYKEIARKIASVHQHNEVPNDISVEKLVSYGRIPHKGYFEKINEEDEKIIEWAINCTQLDKLRKCKVMNLSGGERQRAFIAMALAQKPRILFLDEPTTYLDIYHQIEVLNIIKKLNEENGLTVVMVLHDINQSIQYSDNVIVMKSGKIITEVTPTKIINQNLLKEVYNVEGILDKFSDTGEIYFIPRNLCSI